MAIDQFICDVPTSLVAFEQEHHASQFAIDPPVHVQIIYTGSGYVGGLRENFPGIQEYDVTPVDKSRARYTLLLQHSRSIGRIEGAEVMQLTNRLRYHTYSAIQVGRNEKSSSISRYETISGALHIWDGFKKKTPEELFSFIANSDLALLDGVRQGLSRACFATSLEMPGREYLIDIIGPHVIDVSSIQLPMLERELRPDLAAAPNKLLKK